MIFQEDEIVEIAEIGVIDLVDIEVGDDRLFLANGILTHNSSIEAMGEFDQSHTAGGISKINTCDNAIALYAPPSHKERGDFEFIFLKTRESMGVGQRVKLAYDPTCMRIADPVMTVSDVDKPATYENLRKDLANKPGDKNQPKPQAAEEPGEPAKSDVMSKLYEMMNRKHDRC